MHKRVRRVVMLGLIRINESILMVEPFVQQVIC